MKANILGDAFCDVVVHGIAKLPASFGVGELCDGVVLSPGGSAFNTAIHLSSLLAGEVNQVTLFSALGEDVNHWASVLLCNHLGKHGVRFECVRKPQSATGICVVLSGCGDRSFLTSPGAVSQLSLQDLDLTKLADCDHLHVGGTYSLVALLPDLAKLLARVRELRPAITISMDTNCDSGAEGLPPGVLALVDYIKMNDMEARALCGRTRNDKEEEGDVEWLARQVRQAAFVTQGELGCLFASSLSPKVVVHQAAFPPAKVVDSVGAGDAFNAGLIASIKAPLQEAVRFACACGSIAVTSLGACEIPVDRDRVVRVFSA
ncbi:hypothetical protein BASA81_004950 [Batrachochytrium salamandrivorans]|nr:hypothetical protein BASA81_004950 [Batrachochytrium salamandrivorans]